MGDAEEEERGYKQKEARDYRLMAEAQALTKWSMADLDRSGELDIQEFAAFLHPLHAQHEWILEVSMDEYRNAIDTDGNGLMDLEEVKAWIIQPNVKDMPDVDGDGHLTKDEILEMYDLKLNAWKYDLFVGSQLATDFGEALSRHDEF